MVWLLIPLQNMLSRDGHIRSEVTAITHTHTLIGNTVFMCVYLYIYILVFAKIFLLSILYFDIVFI